MTPRQFRERFGGAAGFAQAETLAKHVAQGVLRREDVLGAAFAAALEDGMAPPPDPAPQFWDARITDLTWTLDDAIGTWELRRAKAEYEIKRAIAPLIQAKRLGADILEAAHAVNTEADRPLLNTEVRRLVGEELQWAVRRARSRHAR